MKIQSFITKSRIQNIQTGIIIIESVDSISKDERGFPLTQYITNGRISRGGYTFTHFKHHHRVLRLISYRMVYNIAIIAQFTCAPREVKKIAISVSYSYFYSYSYSYSPVDLPR